MRASTTGNPVTLPGLLLGVILLLPFTLLQAETDDDWDEDDQWVMAYDPWEPVNRAVYRFNEVLDNYLMEPVARGYESTVPGPIKTGVSNFYDNFAYPVTIINDFLQGKIVLGFADTGRFLVNTTVGILGIFDVARHIHLPKRQEDLGQTFGSWGIGEGPYVVLPFFGPRTLRDSVGLAGDIFVDPLYQVEGPGARNALTAGDVLDYRYRLLDTTDLVEEALDPYVFVRDSYLQQRRALVRDQR